MRFEAVLFDCDGVLVDSEPITNGLLRDMLAEQGWHMTPQECVERFIGKSVKDEAANIAHHTGKPVTEGWLDEFRSRRDAALHAGLLPIAGVEAALRVIARSYGERMACASGADRGKVVLQLNKTGLMPYFEGRIFSGYEMPRTKPAPDVYLAAALELGAPPTRCAVVEDTTTGVTAGVAAGATVFAYAPHGVADAAKAALMAAGAHQLFSDMADLPALLIAA